jgi:hypothetical protein
MEGKTTSLMKTTAKAGRPGEGLLDALHEDQLDMLLVGGQRAT